LKAFGLILGPGNTDALIRRAEALAEGNPTISGLVAKLAEVRRQVAGALYGYAGIPGDWTERLVWREGIEVRGR
jgi:hypothetical protein